jgi:hypothetical protein
MSYDPHRHRRRSLRLKGYDYAQARPDINVRAIFAEHPGNVLLTFPPPSRIMGV